MWKTKFYKIVTCSLLMVHAVASNNGYYAKSSDGFEPSRNIFNEQYMNRDNINQRDINTYDTINRDRDYSFTSRINQQNTPISNSPLVSHSMDSGPPGYKDTSYETINSNMNFMKERLPYNFGKYFVHNNTGESDFGKYGYPDLSQLSNDHYNEGSSYSDFISGNYPTEVPASFASVQYESASDTSTIDDTYINSDHQQFYGKQKGNHFNSKGNYNYGNNGLHIFSSDVYHTPSHNIEDQIKSLNQHQDSHLNDLQNSMSNSPFFNVHGKGINFQSLERPNNYKGNKYLSIYPAKNNLNYAIKSNKNNYVPQSYAKGSGKAMIIKIGGQSIHPRYVYLRGLYHPNTKLDASKGYKKKRSNLLNRQRRPVPVNLLKLNHNNNEHVNENYDDIQASEMYNKNNDYTDNVGLNPFSAYS